MGNFLGHPGGPNVKAGRSLINERRHMNQRQRRWDNSSGVSDAMLERQRAIVALKTGGAPSQGRRAPLEAGKAKKTQWKCSLVPSSLGPKETQFGLSASRTVK